MRTITKRTVLAAGSALVAGAALIGVNAAGGGEARPAATSPGAVRAQAADCADCGDYGSLNEGYNAAFPSDPSQDARFSALVENHGLFDGQVCIKNSDPAGFCTDYFDVRKTFDVNIKAGDEYAVVEGNAFWGGKPRTLKLVVNTQRDPIRCLRFGGTLFSMDFDVVDDCSGFKKNS